MEKERRTSRVIAVSQKKVCVEAKKQKEGQLIDVFKENTTTFQGEQWLGIYQIKVYQ